MLYHYLASDKTGKMTEGEFDADSVNDVLQQLIARELRPVSVKAVRQVRVGFRPLRKSIKIGDKIFLTKYLSLMLRVGTDLLSAINILLADFDKPAVRDFLFEVRDNLVRGRPFYEAFARYPKVFSPVFVNLVKSAEASGNLQQTFEDLSVSLAQEAELRGRVKAALIYPLVLLAASVLIFGFIAVFALPRVADVFEQGGIKPPTFSRIVFGIGLFVNNYILVFLIGGTGLIAFAIYFFHFTLAGRLVFERITSRLPVIRKVRRDLAIQRFAATLSSLMRAGLPIIDALNITADTVGSQELKNSLLRISREGLAKGLTIGEAFRKETTFPRVVVNLVSISEKTGHLEEVLTTLANFYAANIGSLIKSAMAFLEPVLLIVMGLMVSVVALAVIVPVYQLTTQF